MSLVGFKASNHQQQTAKRGADDKTDDRAVPADVFADWQVRWGFTLDAASSHANAKLGLYFTKEDNSLDQSWAGHRVYCNPPYSDIKSWVEKAHSESQGCPLIVMLLPANRTEQVWWQDFVEPVRDRGLGWSVEFLRGRLRFIRPGETSVKPNDRPPFGCCFFIWEKLND